MSAGGDPGCARRDDAGAYVLRALDDAAYEDFAAHLRGCEACRAEVTRLQVVADILPVAVEQVAPPPALKDRVMQTVRSEAELLRAAGPEADRVPARDGGRASGRLGWLFGGRPLAAAAAACLLLAVGIGAGVLVKGGGNRTSPTRTIAAQVMAGGARAALLVSGDRGTLDVRGMPSPPAGHVYQVWLVRSHSATPQPTHTLFDVPDDGHARVQIDQPLRGVREVLVSTEPQGGSLLPTTQPVIRARPA